MAENNKTNVKISSGETKPSFFHNFLGPNSSPAATWTAGDDPSGLGSEKQKHLEGVPLYGPGTGSDLTRSELSNRSARNKRNDSFLMGSSKDGFQNIQPESAEGFHLMKMLRNAGSQRPRHTHNEAMFLPINPSRPISTPHLLGSPSANVGPTRTNIHTYVNIYKDGSLGPSGLSQSPADEGSRTGIKRSGTFSYINFVDGFSDRVPSGVPLSGNIKSFDKIISEPESSALASASQHGSAAGSRQMTIFYGGQAHVFDDVHPNKADMIMAVAGSNGGSWSTPYAKSATLLTSDEAGAANKLATPGQLRRNLSIPGTNSRGSGSGYQISVPSVAGGRQRDIIMNVKHAEIEGKTRTVQKREV